MAIRRTGSQTLVNRGVTAAAATPVNIVTGTGGPTVNISSIQIANSTFVAKDDLAIDTAGGYMIINGTGFQSGAVAYIQGTAATSTSFVSSSRLNVTVPALSSGVLDVYVVNTDGSGSIYLQSLRANGVPSWTTTSPLTTQDTGVTFAINLVATGAAGDGTITYAVSSGSSLPSGTSLASNGYFYGTISGIETETTYSFSVDAIDAQNQETARSFNITVRAGDGNFKDTVLLLNGETSNNTWITDISTNNFAITVNGDTRPVAFSPYETVWSNFFDGTGDYLTVADNISLRPESGDFTIEYWIYYNSIAGYVTPFSKGYTASGAILLQTGNGDGRIIVYLSGTASITESTGATVGRWYHYALVRNGTTVTLYRDGVSVGSTTNSGNFNITDQMGIGATGTAPGGGSVGQFALTGYMSNVRVIKGTAVYTSAFTPPTSPLTAIANTSLLTCQSNRFIDNSTNNFTITRNGNVTVSNFGPFVETDITTGSGYFDGTGDFLELTDSSNLLDIGGAVASVECWYYPIAVPSYGVLISKGGSAADWNTSNGLEYYLGYSGSGSFLTFNIYYNNGGNAASLDNSSSSSLNQWYHLAVATDASNRLSLFVNGTRVATTTNAITKPTTRTSVRIGNDTGTAYPNGYISNIRIIVGTGAYSASASTITVPTSSLTPITNTRLLTLQSRIGENNNRFVDTSGLNNIITRNGNTTQGTFSPYQRGGWSNYFDGSGDFLNIGSGYPASLDLGSSNFTIEGWVYLQATTKQLLLGNLNDTNGSCTFFVILNNTSASARYEIKFGSSAFNLGTGTIPTNQWVHVCVMRSGTSIFLFENGSQVGTTQTLSGSITSTNNQMRVGGAIAGQYPLSGYASNLRMVIGSVVYSTSGFTVPTTPLTAIANTSLLTCADNGFIDDSPNNFTITRNGDVSVQPFSPFKVHTITANTHSVYFDGTGDYLSIPDSQTFMNVGTNDLTIEGWVYFNSVGTGTFFGTGDSGGNSSGGVIIYLPSSGTLKVFGPSVSGTITASVVTGTWYHIAVTRQTNTWTLWLNGTSQGTFTDSGSLNPGSSRPLAIGRIGAYDGFYLTGYVSNVRFINGTALYTSTFTPPTSPLTAIANTRLLTCSSNSIVDLSTANTGNTAYAITVNGDARATTVNPLGFTVTSIQGPTADYSITDEGGSVYFDGNADFLKIDTTNILTWSGTTTFTVEGWFYQTAFDATSGFMNNVIGDLTPNSSFGDALYWSIGMNNSNQPGIRWYGGPTTCNATEALTLFRWNHVAWVVSSGVLSIYINGKKATLSGTSTITAAAASMNYVVVGADRGKYYSGYMSGLRVVKGTALYTSGFVPPAAPQLPIVGTTLLVNGTNGSIIDYTRKNNLETVGDVKIRNNIKKFGNTSMFFDGTGDYLNTPPTSITDLNGDFTIEAWIYRSITTTHSIVNIGDYINASGILFYVTNGNALAIYTNNSLAMSGGTVPATTWTHVALVRSGTGSGNLKLYLNGTNVGTPVTNNTTFSGRLYVGIDLYNGSLATNFMNGYIDDLRITKGVARYTSNFSAPNKHPTN